MPFLLLCSGLYLHGQGVVIEGNAILHNSKNILGSTNYLTNVRIKSIDGGTALTDPSGYYKLNIYEPSSKDFTKLDVLFPGHLVTNQNEISLVSLVEKKHQDIYLADSKLLYHFQHVIYDKLKQQLVNNYKMLERGKDNGLHLANAPDHQKIAFSSVFHLVDDQLLNFSRMLAFANLDLAHQDFEGAFSHFLIGETDIALNLLKGFKIDSSTIIFPGKVLENISPSKAALTAYQTFQVLDFRFVLHLIRFDIQSAEADLRSRISLSKQLEHKIYDLPAYMADLAWVQQLQNLDKAELTFEESMKFIDRLPEWEFNNFITALELIGDFHFAKGQFKDAIQNYVSALKIAEANRGEQSWVLTSLLNKLANAYIQTNDPEKTFCYLNRAASIIRLESDIFQSEYIDNLLGFGLAFNYMGNGKKALEYFEKAFQYQNTHIDSNAFEASKMYNAMATLHQLQGAHQNAIGYLKHVVDIMRNHFSEGHPEIAIALYNLANCYHSMGNLSAAQSFYLETIALSENRDGNDKTVLADTYKQLASIHEENGAYENALSYYNRALEIEKKILSKEHPNLKLTYYNISKAQYLAGSDNSSGLPPLEKPANDLLEEEQLSALITQNEADRPSVSEAEEEESDNTAQAAVIKNVEVLEETEETDKPAGIEALEGLLLQKSFAAAERMGIDMLGQSFDDNEIRIYIIAAQLMQNKYEKAHALWFLFKNKPLEDGGSLSEKLSGFLDKLSANQISNPSSQKLKRLLN